MTDSFVRFDTVPECDKRTDRQTDISALTILAIAQASLLCYIAGNKRYTKTLPFRIKQERM